ncbi:MAG: Uncharacterized protein G01um101429_466 [Parcubacteria group bacterium Gr01-1014_29]|nr:MAG: Uncharacterized protein G01um101429_466 [Parcubacteria group bacterium Gr01-1014_29]
MNVLFSKTAHKIALGVGIVLLLTGAAFLMWPGTINRLDITSSNPNPLIRHFAPTWRSIKRVIDIPYVFFYTIRESDLPIYEITLSKRDKETLFNTLPDYPRVAAMWEEYKKSVKGKFRAPAPTPASGGDYYTEDAKIRVRGVSPNHWTAVKKSWQVNLPEETPYGARETMRFFIPEDKGWIFAAMNAMRAEELGLLSPQVSYARLGINNVDMGIYYLIEGWEESLLERNGRGLGPLFSNLNLDIRDVDLFRPDSLHIWENRFAAETPSASMDTLAYFLDLVASAPDEVFEKELPHIIDMDIYYRWLVITALSGNFHQGNVANQNWYLNPATDKLEPVLFDSALVSIDADTLSLKINRLVNRTMQIPTFNKTLSEALKTYLADLSHKERALAFYDETFRAIRKDILSDTKKIQTSAATLARIAVERDIIENNYDKLKRMLDETGAVAFEYADESYPISGKFDASLYKNSFLAHGTPVEEFLRNHPQFSLRPSNTFALSAGTHIFRNTVVIPERYTLRIDPGATLLFGPGVSLISYSRVESNGTMQHPIKAQALDQKKPWGVIAIIRASGTNTFRHTHIQDGNDATFAGLYFSGSLNLRSSDLDFTQGSIARSHADDGIHIYGGRAHIANTTFIDTSSDGIDIDFAKADSLFEKNTFRNSGGDAMDLSFSDITIRENSIALCGDKGISVGEASHPTLEKNTIIGCAYGIAVKDRSRAVIKDSLLLANETGIGLYRKKPHFIEGGYAAVSGSTLWANSENIQTDEYSTIHITNSVIEHTYQGDGNTANKPSFEKILPADLYSLFQTILNTREKQL